MGVETDRSSFVGLFKGMGEELYFFCSKAKKTRIITAETISEMVIPKESAKVEFLIPLFKTERNMQVKTILTMKDITEATVAFSGLRRAVKYPERADETDKKGREIAKTFKGKMVSLLFKKTPDKRGDNKNKRIETTEPNKRERKRTL